MSKGISIEVEKIEVIKSWSELKSLRNIQVFLGFANFYWQLIQSFSMIAAPLTSILKITRSPDKPAFSRNHGSRSNSSKNNNSRPALRKNNSDNEIDRFGIGENGVKHTKKLGKLFKSRKLKSEKTFKF